MPSAVQQSEDSAPGPTSPTAPATLPFPPVTREHILHCSYHFWHPKYRTITPKARLIPLSQPFVDYLRADGIILPSDDAEDTRPEWSDTDSGVFSASDNHDSDNEQQQDVSAPWRDVHNAIRATITELGGKVVPKLNWSAPKDATWMNANTMECHNPSDIYLLLKSSDFVTHDLEHAFDDTISMTEGDQTTEASIPYHLVLRKAVRQWNPSVEFRCFVRNRKLLCICQRDLNHYDFLTKMSPRLRSLIQEFFDVRLADTFPDDNFVFDVYVPPPHDRVWLVDFNPWAPRTDPLLFGWLEILQMPEPVSSHHEEDQTEQFVRLSLHPFNGPSPDEGVIQQDIAEIDSSDSESADEEIWLPELRLVGKNDPEAFGFGMNAPQYSAHKLPKDVVDASQSGEGLRDFARDWQNILEKRQREDALSESSGTE